MRRLICLLIVISFLLSFMLGEVYCYAAEARFEYDWEYLTPIEINRDIDTVSLHILKKISETRNKSVYRGLTISRPLGSVSLEQHTQDSSAIGIGPIYMFRTEKPYSGKLSLALDLSGGVILYDKPFPAGGRYYNFMWRVGPKFIYRFNETSSVNVGYTLMHVSNGFGTHNPGYDARGISLGFVKDF